jgi:hypothetical protein
VEDTNNGSFEKYVVNEVRLRQVISAFHKRYGKPSAHVSMGETRLVRNVSFGSQWSTNNLNGDVCHHISRFHWAITTQIRAGTTSGTPSILSNVFDHMDSAMMSFRPVFTNEPSEADTKRPGARAVLLQRFPTALSRE